VLFFTFQFFSFYMYSASLSSDICSIIPWLSLLIFYLIFFSLMKLGTFKCMRFLFADSFDAAKIIMSVFFRS